MCNFKWHWFIWNYLFIITVHTLLNKELILGKSYFENHREHKQNTTVNLCCIKSYPCQLRPSSPPPHWPGPGSLKPHWSRRCGHRPLAAQSGLKPKYIKRKRFAELHIYEIPRIYRVPLPNMTKLPSITMTPHSSVLTKICSLHKFIVRNLKVNNSRSFLMSKHANGQLKFPVPQLFGF